MSTFSLGLLNRVYAPAFTPQVYQDALELFSVAEALGFDSGWVAQHHLGCESGRLPAPLPLLAAASQRSRKLLLGTGIIVLPHEPVLRLAEDAAVLDQLSAGRLQLGLGAGFDPDGFTAFGQSADARHQEYDQRLQQLQAILDGQALNEQGQTLNPPGAPLGRRLWEATSRVEQVAARGNGLIVAPNPHLPAEASLDAVARYRNSHPGQPRIALVRALFPGADADDPGLLADIGEHIERQRRIGVYPADRSLTFADELDRLGILYGDDAGILEQLRQGVTLGPDDHLVVQVQTRSTTLDQAIRRLEHIAHHLAPALGWQPRRQPELHP